MKLLLVLALAVSGVALTAGPGSADASSGPARILIVGDSVTQGKVGDYTWRYRLWNTLQAQNKAVDFVGPHTGLFDPATSSSDAAGYADPNFDQDHAAWWGMSLLNISQHTTVSDLMAGSSPDVVIENLGFNDLAYGVTPAQLIDLQSHLVADVRAANPTASVVLGQLTQTWHLNGAGDPVIAQYNALLPDLAASLDQPDARVIVATRPADYAEADTWDTTHPNAGGEVKIAEEFADALAQLPLPNKPGPVPPPPTYSGSAHLAATPRLRAVRLTFTTPSAATRQAVWKRDVTAHGSWRLVAYVAPSAHTYRAASLRRHHRYAFQLRAYSGAMMSTTYSNRVALRLR